MSSAAGLISVVIPTFNRPVQLATCLRGLARQTFPTRDLRIVVVDDGGGVDLSEALAETGEVSAILVRQENRGPAAARNTGVRAAATPLIAFTDDDCVPDPQWIRRLVDRLGEGRGLLVGGKVFNGLYLNRYANASQVLLERVYSYSNERDQCSFFTSNNMALARSDFLQTGGFDERFRTSEDRELCDRWLALGRTMEYETEALVEHRHEIGLIGFLKQHYGYGRGAYKFHRKRRDTGRGRFCLDEYMRKVLAYKRPQRVAAGFIPGTLIACSQLASLAGFCTEWMTSRRTSVAV